MRKYLVAASVVAMLTASMLPGHAAVNVVAAVPGSFEAGFATTDVVISKSLPSSFVNTDLTGHTFTIKKGTNGFWVNVFAGVGQAAPIDVSQVPVGTYEFYCIPHTNMVGTATIQA